MNNLVNIDCQRMELLSNMIYEELSNLVEDLTQGRNEICEGQSKDKSLAYDIFKESLYWLKHRTGCRMVVKLNPSFDADEPEDIKLIIEIGNKKASCHLRNLPKNDKEIEDIIKNALYKPNDDVFWSNVKVHHLDIINNLGNLENELTS